MENRYVLLTSPDIVEFMKKEKKTEITAPETEKHETLVIDLVHYKTSLTTKYQKRKSFTPFNPNLLKAFIPGTIVKVFVAKGEQVTKGQNLLILEAMKMLNEIKAYEDLTVKSIHVNEGDRVTNNQLLIELE